MELGLNKWINENSKCRSVLLDNCKSGCTEYISITMKITILTVRVKIKIHLVKLSIAANGWIRFALKSLRNNHATLNISDIVLHVIEIDQY